MFPSRTVIAIIYTHNKQPPFRPGGSLCRTDIPVTDLIRRQTGMSVLLLYNWERGVPN